MSSTGEADNVPAVVGGRRRSAFSVTCSLLSQYLKENRGGACIGNGSRAPDFGKSDVIRTMNLLPGVVVEGDDKANMEVFPQNAGSGKQTEIAARGAAKAQLTMFYDGKVMVFDNFPEEKARDLLQLAGNCLLNVRAASEAVGHSANTATQPPKPSKTATVTSSSNQTPRVSIPTSSDMPIARSASLHRFLQKRRERITAVMPYHKAGEVGDTAHCLPAAKKTTEGGGSGWLGLGTTVAGKQELVDSEK